MRLRAKNKKERGILLALSSLPSKHGIGNLGSEAYAFTDLLSQTGQSYWQVLPLCPLGKGNSPYSSTGSFGGEILYIDLDLLAFEGLLTKEEIGNPIFGKNVDYKQVRSYKIPLLRLAASRFNKQLPQFKEFIKSNSFWLKDFALFMAIKEYCSGESFLKWNEGLKYRIPSALEEFSKAHRPLLDFYEITQYFFFCQYQRLKTYANTNGIKIIGDIPFYVAPESADVWGNTSVFKLGRDMTPTLIAGVPPDIFSSTGQLWGNPIYDWNYLKNTDYSWWKQRLIHNARLYDAIRIDHFRAFANFYSIPAGSPNAKAGVWEKGVGNAFWNSVKPHISATQIIAEDLGGEDNPQVIELLQETGFPNMKVLHFAFNSDLSNPFLPKNFNTNCVCYTGTHDNNTTLGWYKELSPKERLLFDKLVPKKYNSPVLNLIAYALKSRAKITVIPFQDYLQSDSSCRLNTPATPTGNWEWRFEKRDITPQLLKIIKEI